MSVVVEEPPEDPDDWTEEQWLDWLAQLPPDPDTGKAHPLTRVAHTSGGSVLGAAMFGLEQAIYGERPKAEVVIEADSNGADDADLELDLDDPASSRITLAGDD
jgi:hypothetical protein